MYNLEGEQLEELKEEGRLFSLLSYKILDTDVEQDFEELATTAALVCDSPIAFISFIDRDRQWFKSRYGFAITEAKRSISFCNFTISKGDLLEIEDTTKAGKVWKWQLDITHPSIRHYCGVPLTTPEGFHIGTLCVLDYKAKVLKDCQKFSLKTLGKQVMAQLELRSQKSLLQKEKVNLQKKIELRTSELKEINKELNTFIYKASHDIRGPLATIMGLSSLAISKTDDPESLFYFNHITDTSYRLDRILRNLLKVVQLKDYSIRLGPLSKKEIENELNRVITSYSSDSIQITISLSENLQMITDRELFFSILKQLIDNAVRFRKEDSKESYINIVIAKDSNSTSISVEDNGEGIEEEIKPKIYDMFYRGNSKSRGSGLGLCIVKKAVTLLHGEIKLQSSINYGTKFKITLPDLNH